MSGKNNFLVSDTIEMLENPNNYDKNKIYNHVMIILQHPKWYGNDAEMIKFMACKLNIFTPKQIETIRHPPKLYQIHDAPQNSYQTFLDDFIYGTE